MTKIRVHEYAKQVNKSSKEVIEQLTKINVPVTNHMSMLEKDSVTKLDNVFKKTEASKAPVKPSATQGQQRSQAPSQPRPQGQGQRPQGQGQQRTQGQSQRPQG